MMKKRQYLIYGLADPRTGMLRYVGWSSSGFDRPKARHSALCRRWEKSLESKDLQKEIVVFQEFPDLTDDEANETMGRLETGWIAYFRSMGIKLLNMTDGGEGTMGRRLSEETKQRMSEERKGAGNPMFGKKPYSAGRTGWMTGVKGAEHPMYGYKHSPENKKKMSEAAKRYWAARRQIGG